MPGKTVSSDAGDEESLFSLELVVEKVYLPHTPCRFPAITFRLLDFPTIVINHVETDLEKLMRQKISLDPDYKIPDQFSELKDRHGNFMIKKGKSCLFQMSAETLKQHLENTPLYVMVIDMFPETPKLIGNSTLPLNYLMESICADIIRLGATVPSSHGDKGLFKLYNLMGKEMGYLVVGFRLLCLGPSLIPHLPASSLMQRSSNKKVKSADNMLKLRKEEDIDSDESIVELRNSACMTDPVKHDVILQTVEMEDKAIYVEFHKAEPVIETNQSKQEVPSTTAAPAKKVKKKKVKDSINSEQKLIEKLEHKVDDDDIIISNIVRPPPLFYNSNASPPIEIQRQDQSFINKDLTVEDLSDIDSFDGQGIVTSKKSFVQEEEFSSRPKEPVMPYLQSTRITPSFKVPQARKGEVIKGLQVAPQPNTVFPLLTALINELSCIQDPQLLLQVSNKIQSAENKKAHSELQILETKNNYNEKEVEISPNIVSAVAEALKKKLDNSKDNFGDVSSPTEKTKKIVNQTKLEKSHTKVVDGKKSKQTQGKKNKMLAFGITHTQRLRLQKTNPEWLKQIDEQTEKKSQKQSATKNMKLDDIYATTFSDTLTEVRRLAEKELESTAGGDTLQLLASEVEEINSSIGVKEPSKKSAKWQNPKRSHLTSKSKQFSPKSNSVHDHSVPQPKARTRSRQKVEMQHNNLRDSSDSDDIGKKTPVPLERNMRNIKSPACIDPEAGYNGNDNEEGVSARSDLPSSRSRSIEVHLPSAQADPNDSDAITDDDIPLPDDSLNAASGQSVNLPQYIARTASLPDSIDGIHNESLNVSGAITENSPMESTRHSKNMTEERNDSRIMHSTDYDSRQFHSTEEPELQGLISDEENPSAASGSIAKSAVDNLISVRASQKFPVINPQASENSPVPSVRRSTTKLDAGLHSYLPSMSLSRGQLSPKGQGSPKVQGSQVSSRPGTPTKSKAKGYDLEPINPKGGIITPRSGRSTPRSPSPTPKRPIPSRKKPLKDFRESIHTESLSSYMPSDPDNVIVSLSTSSGGQLYSDDFQDNSDSLIAASSQEKFPKIIPSSKLGYTIT